MKHDSLISSLEAAGQSPCDKFKCSKRGVCASDDLACTSFFYFVETGEARNPRIFFKYLNPPTVERRKNVEPTKAIFESFRPDDDYESDGKALFFSVMNATDSQHPIEKVWA